MKLWIDPFYANVGVLNIAFGKSPSSTNWISLQKRKEEKTREIIPNLFAALLFSHSINLELT